MVYILGGHQTDFARNITREGGDLTSLMRESVEGALAATGIEPAEVEVGHVGNAAGELFGRQCNLGGIFASLHPDLAGLPTARHEAACASGSAAVLAAKAEIQAGVYDLACVTGLELMRNVDGKAAADHLATAAWQGHEDVTCKFLWPAMFDRIVGEYEERYGIAPEALRAYARQAFEAGRRNPHAQTRRWTFGDESFSDDDTANPRIEGRIRKQDCGQITDGAATLLLASERYARAWAERQGMRLGDLPQILGFGHKTSTMHMGDKLAASRGGAFVFPHLRGCIEQAWQRAGIEGPDDVDCMEIHDCFTISALCIVDHLRLVPEGQADRALLDGAIAREGTLPVNPSGGLIGLGHPVGATGVRMLLDCANQVADRAGTIQLPDVRRAQTINIGGPVSSIVSFVVGRA